MEYVILTVSLLILALLVRKPFKEQVLGGLDKRAETIRHEIDEAHRLHEEAKTMLAKYERQLHEGETLAADILKTAEAEQQRLESKLRTDFEALVERRTQQAEERIAQEEGRAMSEIRAHAAGLAVRTTRRLLTDKLGGGAADQVMRNAIGEVTGKLSQGGTN